MRLGSQQLPSRLCFVLGGFDGCARAHPPGVAPEALEEWVYSSRGFFSIKVFYRVCWAHECEFGSLGLGLVAGRTPEPPHGARGRSVVSLSFLTALTHPFRSEGGVCLLSPSSVSLGRWVSARFAARAPEPPHGARGRSGVPLAFYATLTHPFRSEGGVVCRAPRVRAWVAGSR